MPTLCSHKLPTTSFNLKNKKVAVLSSFPGLSVSLQNRVFLCGELVALLQPCLSAVRKNTNHCCGRRPRNPEPVPAESPSRSRVYVHMRHTPQTTLYPHFCAPCSVDHGIHYFFALPHSQLSEEESSSFPLPGLPLCHLVFHHVASHPGPSTTLNENLTKPNQTKPGEVPVNSKTKNRFCF